MRFSPRLLAFAAALATVGVQAAAVHTYDVSFNGSSVVYNQTAAGETMAVGDQVTLTVHTVGGYWSLGSSAGLWAPVAIAETGTRVGDLTMSLLAGASVLQTSSMLGGESQFVHVPQNPTFAADDFDGFTWTYTLSSTDSPDNTLGGVFAPSTIFMNYGEAVPQFVEGQLPGGNVPEPVSLALTGLGLLAAGAARRRQA